MRLETVHRLFTSLIHDDANGVRPSSGVEIFQLGDIGILYSLRGAGFYTKLAADGLGMFRDDGIDTVLTIVSRLHFRSMRQKLKGARVKVLGPYAKGGKPFVLVAIRADYATSPDYFGVDA